METPTSNSRYHHVYIADKKGIEIIFPLIKNRLMENNPQHISLVYLSTDTVFTFRRELQVLQQHYPSQFLIFFENNNLEIAYNEFQETLEVIINSNTMPEIDFILSGDEELINQAENALYILDIDKKSIINSESDNHLFTL